MTKCLICNTVVNGTDGGGCVVAKEPNELELIKVHSYSHCGLHLYEVIDIYIKDRIASRLTRKAEEEWIVL
jgi:hypothetical protein